MSKVTTEYDDIKGVLRVSHKTSGDRPEFTRPMSVRGLSHADGYRLRLRDHGATETIQLSDEAASELASLLTAHLARRGRIAAITFELDRSRS